MTTLDRTPAAIRAWALANPGKFGGQRVAARGRVPQTVRQAYLDAHQGKP